MVASSTLVTNYVLYKKQKQLERVNKENVALSEYMLQEHLVVEGREKAIAHKYAKPINQTLYSSPWSYQQVSIQVWICEECHLAHKLIHSGSELARKKNLLSVEGFYLGNSRIPYDPGCFAPKEKKNV